jgi:hypothetical protein
MSSPTLASGSAKAIWVVALIIFPLIGSLVYLTARGQCTAERSAAQQRAQAQFDSYVRATAASTGARPVDDLVRLVELRNNATITPRRVRDQEGQGHERECSHVIGPGRRIRPR